MSPHPRRIPLRVALLTLVVGLLLATVGATFIASAITSSRSVADLESRYFQATSEAISGRVRAYLEPAISTLFDAQGQATDGRFSTSDVDDLGRYVVARLRHLPTLAWFSYSDQDTGRFVGAWRREDGALVLNRSDPGVNGGRPSEWVVKDDGAQVPFQRDLKGGYDPRTAEWYRRAAAASGPVWTEPYRFSEGVPGITAALAVRDGSPSGIRGVLTADFFLADLSRYLSTLASNDAVAIHVTTRAGHPAASSHEITALAGAHEHGGAPEDDDDLGPALSTAPAKVATIPVDAPVSWTFPAKGQPHVAALQAFQTAGGGEWVTLVEVPEEQFLAGVHGNRRLALGLGALFTAISMGLAWILARRISKPLGQIAADLEQVAHFNLTSTPAPESRVKEIHVVSDAVDRMKASLRSFGRYVPTPLVRELLSRGEEAALGARRKELTLFFSDIEGFTSIGEAMEPTKLVEHLGSYLDAMTGVLRSHDATIDKYVGDGIVAFFNAPHDVEGHPERACRAALACEEKLAALRDTWAAAGLPPMRQRIGLHTAEVLVGNLGTHERFAYTVIGDGVNLASRLEALNKRYGTRILASEDVASRCGEGLVWRRLDRVAVAGRSGGTLVLELLGERDRVPAQILAAKASYERGLDLYFARQFPAALEGFRAAASILPGDKAAALLLTRTQELVASPPGADWDGTDVLSEK